ncbi:tetratricopeptide (TPR) repeat protein [Granulicella aggregans]|uniref:Tetratricopeptide (TPR) repeat protein n=1 Tax=Granulicella aggregans TaxID=474949 RepID=A0A7W8E380_9BACT|nr:tetratricopeptide repeat protein [Granulicella aggregans]MBB5057693.1 tetratricopeptide (TPR) repeat protein [Granulicella aggregans]
MTFRPSNAILISCRRFLPALALCAATLSLPAQTLKHHSDAPEVATKAATPAVDHGASYYHYGLAHIYEDMAVNAGRPDYATQAVEEYKLALNADPDSPMLQNGLADLYFKIGRIREAVTAAKDQISRNPNDVESHKLLGKVYLRSLGDAQNQQSAEMLQLALTEYETLAKLDPNDVENHLLLGQLYGLNHDSAKAEAQFKLAEKIDPNSEESVLNLARLYSVQGDFQRTIEVLKSVPPEDRTPRMELALGGSYDQVKDYGNAAAAYKRALDSDPGNVDSTRGYANALLNDGKLDEALAQFKAVLVIEPTDAQSQIRIADIQRRQGHYEEALATLQKAKTLTKDNQELSYNEALIDDSLGRYDDAIAVLTGLIDSGTQADGKYSDGDKSNRAIFLDRLGIIYREQNKTAQAVDAYKQIIALGGDFVSRGYQGEVDAYRDVHQWTEATAVAAEAAKALPKDRQVQLMYAGQLADSGKVDEGLALAKTQLQGTSDDRDVQLSLAQIDLRLKRYADANAEIDKAETTSKTSGEKLYIHFLRGTVADRQKNYDEAESEFHKALAIDPQNATVLNYIGYMNADRGVKLNEALAQIKKAVDLDPQNYAFLDSLGWVYFKLGQYTEASQNLQKAVERSSTDPTVHDHLGQVYEKTGKLKLAVTQWERSMNEYAHSLPADADPADVAKVQHHLDAAKIKLAKVNTTTSKQ